MGNNKKNIKILVCYHKKDKLFKNDVLTPIHCGRSLALEKAKVDKVAEENCKWLQSNMIGDDTGENISFKNMTYCELTALYWAWKNYDKLGNPEYIGLMHYRRLFDFLNKYLSNEFSECINIKDWDSEKILSVLDNIDIVLPKPFDFEKEGTNIREQYADSHSIDDLNTVIDIMNEKYSDTDMNAINEYLGEYKSAMCNMFVMKRELFFEYCSWLFDILDEAEKKIVVSEDPYQRRVFGFLSERMFNMFIVQRRGDLKILIRQIINIKPFDFSKFSWALLLKKVFSISNTFDKSAKIITILGLKLKINKRD